MAVTIIPAGCTLLHILLSSIHAAVTLCSVGACRPSMASHVEQVTDWSCISSSDGSCSTGVSSSASLNDNAHDKVFMLQAQCLRNGWLVGNADPPQAQVHVSSKTAARTNNFAPASIGRIDIAAHPSVKMLTGAHSSQVLMSDLHRKLHKAFNIDGVYQCICLSCVIGMVVAFLSIGFMSTVQRQSSSCDPPLTEHLNRIGAMRNVTYFFISLSFSIPIVDSLDLATRIGKDAAFSGFIIGIFFFSSFLGSFSYWLFLQCCPTLWQGSTKPILVVSVQCATVGLLFYSIGVLASHVESMRHNVAGILIFARVLCGFSHGSIGFCMTGLVARLWPASDRPTQMASMFLMVQLGIGLGPMFAALASTYPGRADVLLVWASTVSMLVILIWLIIWFPSMLLAVDTQLGEQLCMSSEVACARRWRLFGCHCMTIGRGYIVAGLEVASAMLLEDSFHWMLAWIGLAIGMTFTASVPVKIFYDLFKGQLSIVSWIRMLTACTFAGTLLLATAAYAEKAWFFLLGDALVFPTVYLADGLGWGIMQQNLLPQGSLYADVNNCMLYAHLASNGVGRFVGPWLARWLLQVGGMIAYIASQVVASLIFTLMFEVCVAPGIEDNN